MRIEIAKIHSIIQQWKANAYTVRCGLRCCNDAGVWRYLDATTEVVHTFLFLKCEKCNERMDTKNLGTSITIYACAVISLVLILSESGAAMLAFLLIIVMNVLGYNLVKKKYEKHPELSVLASTNDTWLLYLCKLGGCFSIAFLLCFIYYSQQSEFHTSSLRGMIILLLIILFNVTPSVKDGVKRVQDKYRYSQK